MLARSARPVALVVALCWAVVIVAWEPALWSLLCDDSFYYWQIAKNIAAGQGSTFDGLNVTNGYHPLWMALCTAVFSTPLSPWGAAVATMLLQCAALGLGIALAATTLEPPLRAEPSELDAPVAALLLGALGAVGLTQPLVKVWVNGLESAIYLVVYASLLAVVVGAPDGLARARGRTRAAASVLLALAFLARTDAALLLPCIALMSVPRLWRAPQETARSLVELLLLPSIVVLGFMALNQAWFGSAVQVSGLLKRAPLSAWRAAGAIGCVAGFFLARHALDRAAPFVRTRWLWDRTAWFGLFGAVLVGYYGFLQHFPRSWYFGPVLYWALLIGAAALADLFVQARRDAPTASLARALGPLVALLALPLLGALAWGAVVAATAPYAAPLYANRDAARWAAAHLPADAVLASWDAGVVGFFAERPVVNLDGVVNSVDYLNALRNGTSPAHLAPARIGWVLNHEYIGRESDLRAQSARLLGEEAVVGWRRVRAWPFAVFAPVNGVIPEQQEMEVLLVALGRE